MRPDIYFEDDYDFIYENSNLINKNYLIFAKIGLNRDNISNNLINDHICIGNSKSINNYCNIYTKLFDYYKDGYKIISENIIYKYLNDYNYNYVIDTDIKYKLVLSISNSIGINGDSGSGKSTISNIIKNIFDENETLILECDRYHKWERNDEEWKSITHLNPNANYLLKMKSDFLNLISGNDIYQVDYDHNIGKFTPKNKIETKNNIILCGLHSLYDKELNKNINLKIYLDTQKELKVYWKIKRDVEYRNYNIDSIMNKIKERENDFSIYIDPQKYNADIIIKYYVKDEIKYDNLNEKIKIYLKILYKKNCCTDLIHYLNNKINFSYGEDIIHDKLYYYLKFEHQLKDIGTNELSVEDRILNNFIKEKCLLIKKIDKGLNLILQIFFLLYLKELINK